LFPKEFILDNLHRTEDNQSSAEDAGHNLRGEDLTSLYKGHFKLLFMLKQLMKEEGEFNYEPIMDLKMALTEA